MKKQLRAIFFDIDDTLYSTTEFARLARYNAIQAMVDNGLQIPVEELVAELDEVIAEFSSNYGHHFDKLLLRLPNRAYHNCNRSILIAAAVIAYHNTKYESLKPFPDASQFLQQISTTNIIRGIITAGLEIKQAEKLLRLGLYRYITPQAIFISHQMGISKPNPKLYSLACRSLDILPEEVLYIGDHQQRDIDPAKQVGMVTVHMRKGGKYQEVVGEMEPDYVVDSFTQLWPILRRFDGLEWSAGLG